MLTLVCKLTFADGQEVTGKIEARFPATDYPIIYTGPVDRLSLKPLQGTPSDLELIFKVYANKEGINLTMEKSGDYDSRTEFLKRPPVNGPGS